MAKYFPVQVITKEDECGQIMPDIVIWDGSKSFLIERIIHVCQPEDLIIRYTIKIAGKQRCLYSNGIDWKISNPV